MSIISVRVDGRLIHGQVANLWAIKLNISKIMVADDEVIGNAIGKSGSKLVTPAGVKLGVLPVEKATQSILAGKYDPQRLLTVVRKPDRLLKLVELRVPVKEINAGSMFQTNETRSIIKSINMVDQDIEVFKELSAKGVHLIVQMAPSDKVEDFMSLIAE